MSGTVTAGRLRWGAARAAVAVALLAVVAPAVAVPHAPPAHADAAGAGGDYVPLTGRVVLDTRSGIGATKGVRGAGSTTTFPVLGVGGVPTSGVGAVYARVAALKPTASTWLELWPDGTTRPTLTTLAAGAGEQISTTVVVKVGSDGKLAVFNNSGSTNIVIEIDGYFKAQEGSTGGGFVPVAQTRLIDTRSGIGTATGKIAAGGSRTLTITGSLVPAGAAAAVVDLIVPNATAAGWLDAAPTGGSMHPVLNYETGATHSGAVLPLSSAGQATIANKGSAAADLVVVLEGYYSANPTQGAGMRPVASRLYNTRTAGAGLPVAANGTIDVQVGGTNGLPTRGIAGVAITVVATPVAAGYLKVWPVGGTEPSVTLMDFKAGTWRANSMVVQPGTDGKIRIRNGSSGTAHVIVDLEGWYAEPQPVLSVAQNTPTSVLQAAPQTGAAAGTLEYAYVDNAGRVVDGHQSDLDSFGSIQWTVISGNEAFTGQPSLAQLPDGRIQIAAQNRDGDIWVDTQTAAGAVTWNPWTSIGGSMASPPVAATLSNRTVVQFAVDADGKLWAYAQTGSVPFWRDLGDQNLTATVSQVRVRDGVRIFAVNDRGAVKTIEYYDDGSLSGWTDLGGTGLTGVPALVSRPGYQLQVFVRAADGTIVSKLQDYSGTWPVDWQPVGTPDPQGTTPASAGAPAAQMDPTSGRLAVITRGTDSQLYQVWEASVGSNTWGTWTPSMDATDPAATDPTAATYLNVNGESWIIVFRSPNGTPRIYYLAAGGS